MSNELYGDTTQLVNTYFISGYADKVWGDASNISGDITGVEGDVSNLVGDVTSFSGYVDLEYSGAGVIS